MFIIQKYTCWGQFSDQGLIYSLQKPQKPGHSSATLANTIAKIIQNDYEHYTNTTVRVIQMLLVDGLVYSFPKPQKLGHSSGSFSDDDHSHNIMRLTLRYEWYQLSVMIQTLFKLISYFHLSASHIASAGHLLNLSNFYVFSKKWNLEEEKKGRGWIWATSCEGSPGQQTKRTNVPAFMMKWMTMMENMNNLRFDDELTG